jgi:hypothetical protein
MKVSNHDKPEPGEKAVSRDSLRQAQKRDIATQVKQAADRKHPRGPEKTED